MPVGTLFTDRSGMLPRRAHALGANIHSGEAKGERQKQGQFMHTIVLSAE